MVAKVLGSLLLNVITSANTSGLVKTDKAIRKTSNSLRRISKETGLLGKLSGKLFGGFSIYTAKNLFDSYLQFEKDLGAIKSRFFAITNDELKAKEEFDWIQKVAIDTASDIKGVADSYSIFFSAAQRNLGGEGAREIFKQWTEINRVLHLSNEQFKSVTYALREMSSKGTLYSQDLKIQLGTHVPDAVGIATEAIKNLNIEGVKSIEDFQKKFKNSPKMMAEFLKSFSNVASSRFASPEALQKAMLQPDALAQSIENYKWLFGRAFSESGGNQMIINILKDTLEFIKQIDFYAIADNLSKIGRIIANIFNFLSNHTAGLMVILRAILSILIVSSIARKFENLAYLWSLSFKKGFSKFALRKFLSGENGIIAQSIAQGMLKFGGRIGFTRGLLSGLLRFVGGPWGLVISAITTFLPLITDLFNKIWNKKENKNNLFARYGTDAQSFYNTLSDISQNKSINTTEKLQQALAKTDAGKTLWANAEYNDNGKIIININGTKLGVEDIKKVVQEGVEGGKQNKKQDWLNRFPNPIQPYNYSQLRG